MRMGMLLPGVLLPALALAALPLGAHMAARADSRQLLTGWNNVAYLGDTRPPSEALSPIDGKYSAVYRWDANLQKYDLYAPSAPSYTNSLTALAQGDAIWVLMTGNGSLPMTATTGNGGESGGPGKIAVPASAFLPASDLAIFEKSFNQLNPVSNDEASRRYYAPVNLPDGASITSMTANFEASGGEVQLRLDYTPMANGSTAAQIFKLVEVLSTAGASPQTATAYAHTVDNGANVYFLVVDLTGGPGTKLRGVSIAYTR